MTIKSENQALTSGNDAARPRLRVVGADSMPPARRKISVLYVEDDTDDIFLLGHQLAGLGAFEVDFVHASTLADARFEISRRRFDVILCDFWLASETTVPFIGELKSTVGSAPIILVSSLENDDIELIGRRAGVDGFVAKSDLNTASLGRIFATLLADDGKGRRDGGRSDRNGGVAGWLKALLKSLDRVHAASSLAMAENGDDSGGRLGDLLDEIVGNSAELRADILDKLAGLENAMRRGSRIDRFDAVPQVGYAIRRQSARASGTAAIGFQPPILPVMIEADPTLFGDLIDGFLAEAGDLVARDRPADIRLAVGGGVLSLSIAAADGNAGVEDDDDTLAGAAALERRLLVETLVRSAGGRLLVAMDGDDLDGDLVRLEIPLRTAQPG